MVFLSIFSMPTLCPKDPLIVNDTIHVEFLLTVGVINRREMARVLATQKPKLFGNNYPYRSPQPNGTLNVKFQLTDWLLLTTFSKPTNFYLSKIRILVEWCHLAELLRHLLRVPNSLFPFPRSNLWHESILFTFCPSFVDRWCTHLNFPIWSNFCSKISANWKSHSPTKPDN